MLELLANNVAPVCIGLKTMAKKCTNLLLSILLKTRFTPYIPFFGALFSLNPVTTGRTSESNMFRFSKMTTLYPQYTSWHISLPLLHDHDAIAHVRCISIGTGGPHNRLCNRLLFYSKCTGFNVCFTYSDISLTMYINQ